MDYSIVVIDSTTSKQDFLLQLVSESKKAINKVYVDIQSLPAFLDGGVSLSVFLATLRSYPKYIIWTSEHESIVHQFTDNSDVIVISYDTFHDEIGVQKSEQKGILTSDAYEQLTLEGGVLGDELPQGGEKDEHHTPALQQPTYTSFSHSTSHSHEDIPQKSFEERLEHYHYTVHSHVDNEKADESINSHQSFEEKMHNLDSMIARLEKTKQDLTRKGRYPLKVSELLPEMDKQDWIRQCIPLSSVRASFFFVILIVIISFAILLRIYPI